MKGLVLAFFLTNPSHAGTVLGPRADVAQGLPGGALPATTGSDLVAPQPGTLSAIIGLETPPTVLPALGSDQAPAATRLTPELGPTPGVEPLATLKPVAGPEAGQPADPSAWQDPSGAGIPVEHAAAQSSLDGPTAFPAAREAVQELAHAPAVETIVASDRRADPASSLRAQEALYGGAAAAADASQFRIQNDALDALPPYIFGTLKKLGRAAAEAGHDLIDLSQGTPDQPPPRQAIEALAAAAADPKNHTYPRVDGTPELREGIAAHYLERFGVRLNPETEIFPMSGSKQGLDYMMMAMLRPGDRVLVMDPGYPAWASQIKASGGKILPMRSSQETGFLPDLDQAERQVAEARGRGETVRAMILNFPTNPTGAVVPDLAYLQRAVYLAKRNNLLILYDNAYSELGFDGYVAPTILQVPGAKSHVIEFHSFSKSYSMSGDRIAYVVGNPEAVAALAKRGGYNSYGIPVYVQAMALAALREGEPYIQRMRAMYQERRDALLEALRGIGWDIRPPKGAMYVWARLPAAAAGLSSFDFVRRLIADYGVVVTPGSAFGEGGEGYVRISLIQPPERLREAAERIGRFLQTLSAGG